MNITRHLHLIARFCAGPARLASVATKPPSHESIDKSCSRDAMQEPGKSGPGMAFARAATAVTFLVSGMAFAQTIDNPPLLPMNITVFPSRDFVSVEGFTPNADVLVQLRRSGVVSDAVGRTDATGFVEVNHPGGVCWRNVTPDIVAGDTVRVTYRDTSNNQKLALTSAKPPLVIGAGAAVNTQNVTVTQASFGENNTVVVKGSALLANGSRIPLNRIEVRIVNPEFLGAPNSRITKRDIRAVSAGGLIADVLDTSATLSYDTTTANFTAVFSGLTLEEQQLAVSGQTRVMAWQQTTPAGDRLGMTIFEAGEVGGPGFGGCPAGPNGVVASTAPTPPVHYVPSGLLDASDRGNQPSLKDVIVFPERDFVSIDGFPAGTELQVVVRRGTSDKPVVGTARGIVGRGGLFEVNHPGGVCWSGQTPNIVAGDMVDVFVIFQGGFNSGQTQRVIDAKVTKGAFINANGEVRVNGTATDNGAPLPLRFMEQRIINPDFTNTSIGRRDIRADTTGGRVGNLVNSGNLLRTGDSLSTEWRAVYTGLSDAEKQLAVAGQSRAMAWLSTNANGDRFGLTISEFGEVGGPGMGGCPGPGSALIGIP